MKASERANDARRFDCERRVWTMMLNDSASITERNDEHDFFLADHHLASNKNQAARYIFSQDIYSLLCIHIILSDIGIIYFVTLSFITGTQERRRYNFAGASLFLVIFF